MKVEAELSDKEWRQMRRQMAKLDFEPVPETPALLPRSLYGESDKDLREEEEEKPEEIRESALISGEVDSLKKRMACDSSPDGAKQSEKTIRTGSGELPSTSMAVSPLITSRYRPREQKRALEGRCELNDAEFAALDAQMAAAQEATRRSVMSAFIDLKAKKARNEALEHMKLSAAHTNDMKIIQNKVDKLKQKLARAEAQREVRDLLLDRFSGFTAKQMRLKQMRWSGEHSLAECFHAWTGKAQQTKAKRSAFRHVLAQSCKRQQLVSFRHWKDSVRGAALKQQLEEQRDRFEHRIVEMAKEYQLKIQQLQHEIDDAKYQVAESHKCRQKLEEDLRLIFLRGVSAMNIEALTVFGSNHKQNRDHDRSIPPSRQLQSYDGQIAESVKSIPTPSGDHNVPEAMLPPKQSDPKAPSESNIPDPIEGEVPDPVRSTPPHSRVSVVRSSCSQAPPYLNRTANGWSRLCNTAGMRSAEMIRQHELSLPAGRHSASRSASSSYRPSSAPSPTKKRLSPQLNAQYQVEMQYVRSTVAVSAARTSGSTCTRPVPATRSSLSSARSRRS